MEVNDVEKVWNDFWKEIVCDENGNLDLEQVKKELYDCYTMINEVPKVYCEITRGTLSKPIYPAEVVLDFFRKEYQNKALYAEYLADDWDNLTFDCETNEDYKTAIFDYLEIV